MPDMPMRPVVYSTLADYKAGGLNLWANCAAPRCAHGAKLNIDGLIDRFGLEYQPVGSSAIQASVVCQRCGARGATLTVSHGHPTTETGARREDGGAN